MAYQQDSNDEIPDWLKDLPEDSESDSQSDSNSSSKEEPTPLEEETSSESKIRPDPNLSSDEEETSSQEEESSDTEWLDGILVEDDQDGEEEAPKWLKNIRDLKTATGSLSLSDDETTVESSKISGDLDSPEEKEDQPQPEDQDSDELADDPPTTENDGEEELDPTDEESPQTPEWLENIRSQQALPSSEEIEKQKDPNWLDTIRDKYFEDTQEQKAISEKSEPEPAEDITSEQIEETPNWLQGLEEKSNKSDPDKSEPEKESSDLPVWLQDIMAGQTQEEEEVISSDEKEMAIKDDDNSDQETREILSDQIKQADNWVDQFKMDGVEIPPDQLPDWVLEPPDISADIEPEETEISDTSEMEPAEIPGWLDDIAPVGVEGSTNGSDIQPEDLYLKGPLAELSDPLPLEPAIKKIDAPNIPTQDILLTDIQEKHVSYIFDLIKSENLGQNIGKRRLPKPQTVLQIIIAIILFISIIFPVFGQNDLPKPVQTAENVQLFYDQIINLSNSDHVLVAIEYQPGFIGELETGAAAVLNEIFATGAQVSFITSNPVGPGLINHLVTSKLSDQYPLPDSEYSSIGYISGGSAGLLHFAESPQLAAIEFFEDHPSSSSIASIRDYSLILVVTDDFNNALSWLEQVQPKLTNPANPEDQTKFLMLTSSQLDALMFPYFSTDPQKINGYVSGMKGISQFETISENSADNPLWNGYSRGLSVSILIIIIGSAYQLIISRFKITQRQQDY